MTTARDGTVWVALAGRDELLRLEPTRRRLTSWRLPAGVGGHPHAVAATPDGAIWVSTLAGNALLRFDPRRERFDVVPLPTPRAGVRALAVDAQGRIWYAASGSGRIGVVE
jgi:virginiamycin B lyase